MIVELKCRSTGASTSRENMTSVKPIAKPLGLRNMELAHIPLPELPNETQTGEYVTTLGKIIPLTLWQRYPHITIMDTIETSGNKVVTIPCFINLRCQDTKNINKWQSKEVQLVLLPNKTIHITGGENKAQDIIEHHGRYSLDDRPGHHCKH